MKAERATQGLLLVITACLVVFTACGAQKQPGVGHPLTGPELKYRLIDKVGLPLFCGPPVMRMPSPPEASQEVATLRSSDPSTYAAIVAHEELDADHLTYQDEIRILEQRDRLAHLSLTARGELYAFDYTAAHPEPTHVAGTIDKTGAITLEKEDPTKFPGFGGCPICLAAGTSIDTPNGPVRVTRLTAGMLVWTFDAAGHRIAAPVLEVGHMVAPAGHQVVRLELSDGRRVEASPSHPTSDGRQVGQLKPGDSLDGSMVRAVDLVPYAGNTWDLLPAGPTGVYWADGVLLGTTLKR